MNLRNWISPNAMARNTMANPPGMARARARVPLGIMLGHPSRPRAPKRAVRPPLSTRDGVHTCDFIKTMSGKLWCCENTDYDRANCSVI